MTTINERLAEIQTRLHAPKDKNNSFGGYKYRNAEGIIAAFKALNVEGATLRCTDTVQEVGGQIFITSEAVLCINGETVSATGHAMHPLQKKGMDASQITGSASSYARKYALSGLFAIDDSDQDPDSRDNREEQGQRPPPFNAPAAADHVKGKLRAAQTLADLQEAFVSEQETIAEIGAADAGLKAQIVALKDTRKSELLE